MSGPGARQFAILPIPFLTMSMSTTTSAMVSTSLNRIRMSPSQSASLLKSCGFDHSSSQNTLDLAASGISLVDLASPPSSLNNCLWLFRKRLFCRRVNFRSSCHLIFVVPAWILFFKNVLTVNAPRSVNLYFRSSSSLLRSSIALPLLISSI